jgi:BON domain-containing protein
MDYDRERDRSRIGQDWRERDEREEPPREHLDPTWGARWGEGYRRGFGRWGVGWGLQNFGGGPQGYGWGGGWLGGHSGIYHPGRFGAGYAGAPELTEPGRFAGRGPKGYARSDERIREDVSDRLWADPWIDASEMTVTVTNGEVTLEGIVDDRLAKRLAENVAESCIGVRDVHNRLRLRPREGGAGTTSPLESGSASPLRRKAR